MENINNKVKKIVEGGLKVGYSMENIITRIKYTIATKEELDILEFSYNLENLNKRAEKLYYKYRKEYYNK